MDTSNPHFRPSLHKSKLDLYYPNGSKVSSFSSETGGDDLRGNSFQIAIFDELCKVSPDRLDGVLSNLKACMRGYEHLGPTHLVYITTPKNIKPLRKMVEQSEEFDSEGNRKLYLTRGTSYENTILTKSFFEDMRNSTDARNFEQEINAVMLTQSDSALFRFDTLDDSRVMKSDISLLDMDEVVLSVDPTLGKGAKRNDECGIVLVGKKDNQGYVFNDFSERMSPDIWVKKCVSLYHKFNCTSLVLETNAGSELMVEAIIKEDPTVRIVRIHSSVNKLQRCLPVAGLFENNIAHLVGDEMSELEEQLCDFDEGNTKAGSDDRLDAMCQALVHLLVRKKKRAWVA